MVDAQFIWTEPHSRRIKMKLTVEKEVMNNTNLQKQVPIEFIV
jgi:nonsense-mediated mRNA decay protein 3